MNLIIPTLIYGQIPRGGSKVGWTAVLDLDDFSRSAAKIDDTFDDMSSASARFDNIMGGIGTGIGIGITGAAAKMGGAIIGALTDGIEMSKQFEQAMAKVRTLIQVTDAEFNKLGKGVLAISERLPQTVDSLTDALFNLISAGVETKDSLDVLELSARAATAGFLDVSTVASLGVSTLNAFSLEISDLNRVYDIFFETSRIGVTDFSSLASSIGSVLPSARDLGVSLESLGAAFAAATKGGISTSEVATGLVATFRNLAARREDLEKLANVKIFDAGEFRGLVPIFNDLSETLGKLSREGRVELLDQIGFDAEASKIISTFTNDMDTFNESLEATTKSAGAMGKAFDTAISTTENQISILGNRIKTLSLNVLTPFVGLLGSAAGGINRLFDGFDASRIVSEFETLQTSTQDQIQQLETLRQRFQDVTTTLRNTASGTAEHTRASGEQKTIIEAIQKILPEAVVAYDDYGKAISISVKHINDFIDAQKRMLSAEFVSHLKQMTDQITGYSRAIRRAREAIGPFEERLAVLETIGRDAFISIAKAADATDISWREGVIATLSDFTSDSGTLSDF
ncbi:phage tail tape measure protein, partial [Candidatus Poribacteria bacterium]|nr:phage tail tape measure protein [Candidatus Poribacteria bacterium]